MLLELTLNNGYKGECVCVSKSDEKLCVVCVWCLMNEKARKMEGNNYENQILKQATMMAVMLWLARFCDGSLVRWFVGWLVIPPLRLRW